MNQHLNSLFEMVRLNLSMKDTIYIYNLSNILSDWTYISGFDSVIISHTYKLHDMVTLYLKIN
jgi:hypothetical protein